MLVDFVVSVINFISTTGLRLGTSPFPSGWNQNGTGERGWYRDYTGLSCYLKSLDSRFITDIPYESWEYSVLKL